MSDVSVTVLKNWRHPRNDDCEAIAKDYTEGEMSLSEIMTKHNIPSFSTVIKILDKMGVKRRSISEGLRLWRKKRRQRYVQKLSTQI